MNPAPVLYLASTSPARRSLLDACGLRYRAEAPGVEEDVAPGTTVEATVRELSERKARAVAARHPEAWVIGSDQLAAIGAQVLGKPADRGAARAQLDRLRGNEHRLVTGVCLLGPGFCELAVEEVRLEFHRFDDAERDRYLDTGEWEGCAGGYRIEARGQCLVKRLEGDRATVMGLPVLRLLAMLRARGFPLFEP